MAVEDSVAQDQLRSFIERIEHLQREKDDVATDIKEVKQEAKSNGFDVRTINEILRIRKQDPHERMEQEALRDLYMSALGMSEAPAES